MKTSTILSNVLDRIEDPDDWCQGDLARNLFGGRTLPEAEDAVKWCLMGAVTLESTEEQHSAVSHALVREARDRFGESLADLNDLRGHAAVLEVVRSALTKAQARGD